MPNNATTDLASYDFLIIGAGPAGLQLGYYLQKSGRSYLILEAGDSPGTFFKSFPRHGTLISINKVYTGTDNAEFNMRFDWNSLLGDGDELLFKHYSKDYFPARRDIVRYLADFARHNGLNISYESDVVKVTKQDGDFVVECRSGGRFSAKRLVVASGVRRPYLPPIPGIELAEKYYDFNIDPEEFTDQRVLIIGKGNSAFETADAMVHTAATIHLSSPTPLKLAWKSHFVGHLRAVNNNFLDTYLLKSQNGMLDAHIESIEKANGKYRVVFNYTRAPGSRGEFFYDRVIACTGFKFDESIFDESCKPELTINSRFPNQTSEWESTNVKDLYFAGTLTQMRDFKKTTSGFIHGFRYNVRTLGHILEHKYYDRELPAETIPATAPSVVKAVQDRINSSAALWQQFGFLCDVVALGDNGEAGYYRELPVDYVHEHFATRHPNFLTVTLEYGPDYPDYPFDFVRHTEVSEAHLNPQLHPVIRSFRNRELAGDLHVLEDLEAKWVSEIHTLPMLEFMSEHIG